MLKTLQNQFIKAIYGDNDFFTSLLPVKYQNRLDIYQNNLFLGLLENLSDKFAITKILLGEEFFDNLGREYIKAHPKNNGDNNLYGDKFSQFLQEHRLMQDYDFVSQIAKLEFIRFKVESAPIEKPINIGQVFANLQNAIPINLMQHAMIFKAQYNCLEIYLAHLRENYDFILRQENCQILIFRDEGFDIGFYPLSDFQLAFLENLKTQNFAQALEITNATNPNCKAQEDFASLCNLGIFKED